MTDAGNPTTGVVTFLFTDIEGSTRLELALGTARYATVRERHRELLRAAFAANGGTEQSTQGDSFFVLFESARSAIHAAIEGQRALAREPWPDGTEVLVRMGMHAGEAMVTVGDVVGYDVNRAARIAAVANGGQIVISDTVRALAGAGSDGAFELRDLGEHRLKDLLAPERLAQVVAVDLQSEFPPLHSIDARPNNLPTQLTSFVGRRDELEEALGLLRGSRLLTLTGPGGIGKTRLSLQIAAAAADEFPDGVWFVPLEPVRERELVAPTIARTIGVTDKANRPVVDGIAEALGEGRVLFVLDNFEQVIDAAPVLPEMLARSPGLRILVSSRTALRVYGEQEFAVPGLPTPPDPSRLPELERLNLPTDLRTVSAATLEGFESAQLFLARARAVRPAFELTDANAPAIGRITARLHGMPLAIELAAARVKLLSPEQIVARLEDHLALLTVGLAGPAGAPADPAGRDRVELRPARTRHPPAAQPAVRVRRWLRPGPGRPRLRPRERCRHRCLRWCRDARRPEPASRRRGRGRAALRDVRRDPRVRGRDADGERRVRRHRGTAQPRLPGLRGGSRAASWRAPTSGAGSTASSASTTTSGRP